MLIYIILLLSREIHFIELSRKSWIKRSRWTCVTIFAWRTKKTTWTNEITCTYNKVSIFYWKKKKIVRNFLLHCNVIENSLHFTCSTSIRFYKDKKLFNFIVWLFSLQNNMLSNIIRINTFKVVNFLISQ